MLLTMFRFIWPSGFRGEYFFKSANQKQELPLAAIFVNGSGQNEQSLERTFHRCFLPSFTSFGWEVSEEKIKMWKVNGRQMPSDGKSSHCLWQGELKTTKTLLIIKTTKILLFMKNNKNLLIIKNNKTLQIKKQKQKLTNYKKQQLTNY
jgi:hypothetical protein